MSQRIADNLILVFTAGVSLEQWRDSGLLTREWALYRAILADGWYDQLVLVTYGNAGDAKVLDSILTPEELVKVNIVSNERSLGGREYAASLSERVRRIIAPGSTSVVKTNQMHGGDTGLTIAQDLKAAGHDCALIARGGYLWSRFVAHELGPSSRQAIQASLREGLLCREADIIVGTTGRMIEDLAWKHELDSARMMLVPNFVLVDHPISRVSSRTKGLLLYAGQLVARKRVDILVRAIAMIPKELGAMLHIIGSGPSQVGLEALAKDLDAPVKFSQRMAHEDLLAEMGRCSAYVQASDLEGHPKTVLEAMTTGAPVIVADTPGLGGVVRHGATGLKVLGEPASFAHAIETLLGDEDWRDVLGTTAAQVVRTECGLPKILELEREAHVRASSLAALRRRAQEQAA